MRKYTLSVRSVVAALMVSFISKSVFAATPIAVWDGDFSNATNGGFTLSTNENEVAPDGSTITINQNVGVKITGGNIYTVVVKAKNYQPRFDDKTEVVVALNGGTYKEFVGMGGRSDRKTYAVWLNSHLVNGNLWASTDPVFAQDNNSHYYAITYSYTASEQAAQGTKMYVNGDVAYYNNGLRSNAVNVCNSALIGGPNEATDTKQLYAATGMIIEGIAIFGNNVSEAEIKSYRFDSDYSEESISGTVRISDLEEKIGETDTLINIGEGTTIIVDKVFDTKEKAVSIRSDYDVEFVLDSNTTEDMLKSVIANTSVNIDVARLVFDVSGGFTISNQALKDKIRTSGLTYVFKGEGSYGLIIEYPSSPSEFASHLIFVGGAHTFLYNREAADGKFAAGHSSDNPTLWAQAGTTLNVKFRNMSGWNASANKDAVIRVSEGATLKMINSEDKPSYYSQRLHLEPGARLIFAIGNNDLRLNGGTNKDTAQIYVPDFEEDMTGKPVIIEQEDEMGLRLSQQGNEKGGYAIYVGRNAKLVLQSRVSHVGDGAKLVKYGEGVLELAKGVFEPAAFELAEGTLATSVDVPIALSNTEGFKLSGNVTIDVPENRILNIKSNITTTEDASLSKLGAGKLVIATARPNFAALEGTLQVVANDDEIALGRVDIPTTMSDRQLSTSGFIVRPANKPTLDLMDAKVSGGHILLTFANGAGIKVTGFDFDYGNGLTNLTMTATVNLEKNHSLVTGNKLSAVVSLVTAEGHKTTSEATALTVKDDKVVVTLPIEFDGLQGEIASYTVTIRDSSGNLVGSVTTTDVGAWDRGNKWIDEKPYQRWGTGDWDYENELVVSNGYIIVNGDLGFTPKNAEKSDLVKLAFSVDFGDPIAFETAEEKLGGKKLGIVMISEGLENAYAVVADNGSVSRVYPSTIDKKVESGIVHDVEIIIDQRSKKVSYLVDSAVLTTVDNKAIFDLPVDSISEIDFGSYGLVKAVEGSELSDALAKVGEQEYRSVAEAIAASEDGKVTILWPATWTPGNIAAIGEDDEIGKTTIEFSGKPVIVPDSVANGYWNAGMVLVKDSDTKYTITSKYLTISITEPMSGSKKPVYIESVKTNSTMVAWKYNYGKPNEDMARAKIIYGDNVTITFSNDLEDGANGALLFARKGAKDGSDKDLEEGLQIKEVIFHNVKSDTEVDLRYIPTLGELEETARAKVMALYDYGVAAAQALPDTSLDIIDFTASADGVTFRVSALEGMTDEAKKAAVGKLVKFSSDLKNWAYVSADDSITINEDGSITVRQIGSGGFYKVEIPEE